MPRLVTVSPDAESLAEQAADAFVDAARESIGVRGRFVVALAGGSTPRRMYQLLAAPPRASRVDWSRTLVFLGDERLVPVSDERSNLGMARAALLDHVPLPRERLFPPRTDRPASECAASYARTLAEALGGSPGAVPPRFDLILLGLGGDGHTASLFPHHPSLKESHAWVVATPPGTLPPPVDRISFTFPLLNAARRVMFLVAGDDKADAVRDVLTGEARIDDRPSAGVRPTAGELLWLLDAKAAAKLPAGVAAPAAAHERDDVSIRLVVSDVDGTLVDRQKQLTAAAFAAVDAIRASGTAFAIVSSRPPAGVRPLVSQLCGGRGGALPFGAFNGGLVFAADGRELRRAAMSAALAAQIVAALERHGVDVWVFGAAEWHVRRLDGTHVDRERISSALEPRVLADHASIPSDVLKVTGVSDDAAQLDAASQDLAATFGGEVSMSRSQRYYLDFTHPDANKGAAVVAIAGELSIPLSQTAVIGDGLNDIPMFRVAALSVAMGNGEPSVQAAAEHVTAPNDDDGFAAAVTGVILPRTAARRAP